MIINNGFKPRAYQANIIKAFDQGFKRIIAVAHRRSGKDLTAWNILIAEALKRKALYFYAFPSYAQAKKAVYEAMTNDGKDFISYIPKQLIANKNDTDLKITLKNGSIIRFVGTDNVDSLLGSNPIGIVFSEAALQEENAWHLLSPILAANGGWSIFVSTPRGKNWFWKLFEQAKDDKNWYRQLDSVNTTNAISKEVLEEEKKNLPLPLFEQEYLCRFSDGADQIFRNFEHLLIDEDLVIDPDKQYKIGIDLAKSRDFTVLAPIDLHSWKIGKLDRFQQDDWMTQTAKIELACMKYNYASLVVDTTGLGSVVSDHLKAKNLPIEPFLFTGDSRTKLLLNLKMRMENNDIRLPNDPILIDELKSFRYQINISPTGQTKVSYAVPAGSHDDCVFAVALSVMGLTSRMKEPRAMTSWEAEFRKSEYDIGSLNWPNRFHY